ncbi:hypothetical protein scyTo_0023842 [Scyliorhinus torazame]|uniref:Uncharacterized protein n=1 Tax=Scyliorhinus torazame TaxID=75743 RepID=A0A401QD39_SCYTO|nr:hypothetical protein [Scyliorhinus torazame]
MEAQEKTEKCVCIVQRSCVNVHTVDGKDYIAPLPFQVIASVLKHFLAKDLAATSSIKYCSTGHSIALLFA